MSEQPLTIAAAGEATQQLSRTENGRSDESHSRSIRGRSESSSRVGPATVLCSSGCDDDGCHHAPVFDHARRLCQVCVALPDMDKSCLFCGRKCATLFEGICCQTCARDYIVTNHSKTCISCHLLTVFHASDAQCAYCADDVSLHTKQMKPQECTGCDKSSLGFARSELDGQVFCWKCAFAFNDDKQRKLRCAMSRVSVPSTVEAQGVSSHDPIASKQSRRWARRSAAHSNSSKKDSPLPHDKTNSSIVNRRLPAKTTTTTNNRSSNNWIRNNNDINNRRLPPMTTTATQNNKNNSNSKSSSSYFPPSKLPIGLSNVGNTCFMNSVLQCLLNLPEFRKKLNDANLLALLKSNEPLIFFRELIKLSQHIENKEVVDRQELRDLKTAVAQHSPIFLGYEQQDAHEFLIAVLSVLSDELSSSLRRQYAPVQTLTDQIAQLKHQIANNQQLSETDQPRLKQLIQQESDSLNAILPTENVFQSEIVQQLECSVCHAQRYRLEHFHHLSLDLPAVAPDSNGSYVASSNNAPDLDVQSLLSDYFSKPHTVDFKCSAKDCTGTSALQTPKLQALPKVLACHLKRFNYIQVPRKPLVSDSKSSAASKTSPADLNLNAFKLLPKLRGGAKNSLNNLHSGHHELVDDIEMYDLDDDLDSEFLDILQANSSSGDRDSDYDVRRFSPAAASGKSSTVMSSTNVSAGSPVAANNNEIELHYTKSQARVRLNTQINLLPFCSAQRLNRQPDIIGAARSIELGDTTYKLHAAVHHKGLSAVRGHYVASVRVSGDQEYGEAESNESKFVEFDDSGVTEQNDAEALNGTATETAYILFYICNNVADAASNAM